MRTEVCSGPCHAARMCIVCSSGPRCPRPLMPAGWHLASVQRQVTAYYERFRPLLNPANAQRLQLLLKVTRALASSLDAGLCQQPGNVVPTSGAEPSASQGMPMRQQQLPPHRQREPRVSTVNALLFELGLDDVNMFVLIQWLRDNRMVFKVGRGQRQRR